MGFLATGGLTEQMVANLVTSRWDQSEEYNQKFKQKVREWYNLYRCIYTGGRPPFKNVVMLPLLFAACWSDVANKCAISLSSSRIIEMDSMDPDWTASAKRAEALINQQFLDTRILEKMIDFLMSGDVYGTGILQYGWRKDVVPYTFRQNILGVTREQKANITLFDGPDTKVIDILDFGPQPGKKTIDDMLWVTVRYFMDLDDMEEQAYLATARGEEPAYDPESIARLKAMPMSSSIKSEMNERQQVWRSYSEFQARRQERYSKPVEMLDMIGIVPSEFATDGSRLRVMTVANRQVAMRNVPSPYWDLRKHFRSYCPMPDMHYFHGAGKVEMGATLAASGNKLVSNRLDVLDLALQPAMFVSDNTEMDSQNLVLWPGRVIKIHGETGEQQIRPVQFNLEAYGLVVNELEAISRYVDMATGAQRDTIQGALAGGGGGTAREFLGRMEQARTRLGLEAKLFERAVIEPLAADFLALDRQFLDVPKAVHLIGSAAQMDPDTGMPMADLTQEVQLMDINLDHRIRAIGASEMLTKSMKRQDLMTASQLVGSNPTGLQTTNWTSFWSKFWRAFDFDPREMMVQGGAQPSMNTAAAAGASGAPTGPYGVTGDMLDTLAGSPVQGAPNTMGPMPMLGAGMQQNIGQ